MKNSLTIAFVAALAAMGCHSKESLNREQQNYQVVQEGSTATGTSTSLVQTPPITGTNADTTTSFTIGTNGVPQQASTSTAPLMPAPNVSATGGAAMPDYPIPPGLARNIGGGSSSSSGSSSTVARRAAPASSHASPSDAPQPSMTSAAESTSTHSTSTANTAPSETTASAPPASTETAAPRDKKAAPGPSPAPAEDAAPADEPSSEAPPATQTGTFGPR